MHITGCECFDVGGCRGWGWDEGREGPGIGGYFLHTSVAGLSDEGGVIWILVVVVMCCVCGLLVCVGGGCV